MRWFRAVAALGSAVLLVVGVFTVAWLDVRNPPAELVSAQALDIVVNSGSTRAVCPGEIRLTTESAEGDDVSYDPIYDPQPTQVTSRVIGVVGGGKGARAWTVGASDLALLEEGALHVLDQVADASALTLASGTAGAAGEQMWTSLRELVTRHRRAAEPEDADAAALVLRITDRMGRGKEPAPGSVPEPGDRIVWTLFEHDQRGGPKLPDPEETPWTHGGPPGAAAGHTEHPDPVTAEDLL